MRVILLAGTLLLGACASAERLARIDDEKCISYGFKPGTQPYSQCRLQLETNRTQAKAAIGAAVISSPPTSCTSFGNTVNCY